MPEPPVGSLVQLLVEAEHLTCKAHDKTAYGTAEYSGAGAPSIHQGPDGDPALEELLTGVFKVDRIWKVAQYVLVSSPPETALRRSCAVTRSPIR